MSGRWAMAAIALVVAIGLGGIYWRTGDRDEDAQRAPAAAAAIVGSVADLAGRPIANAEITVDGVPRVARTDAHGRFRLPDVPRGTHVVRVAAAGYAADEQTADIAAGAAQVEVAFRLAVHR